MQRLRNPHIYRAERGRGEALKEVEKGEQKGREQPDMVAFRNTEGEGEGIPDREVAHLPSAVEQPGERESGCEIWDQEGWVRQGQLLPWWGETSDYIMRRRLEVSA